MSDLTSIIVSLNESAAKASAYTEKLRQVAVGDENTTVDIDGTIVPSLKRAVGDLATTAEASASSAAAAATAAEGFRDQASEIAGLGTVADAVGVINLPQPDVYIPFNDGLRIESGYGTFDQVDVSAAQDGSIMVDLPTRSVDFSRASSSTGINKSGDLVSVGVDEPVITNGGLQVFSGATNINLWSNDLSNPHYIKNGVSVSRDGTTLDDGTEMDFITESLTSAAHRLEADSIPFESGVTYNLSAICKEYALGQKRYVTFLVSAGFGGIRVIKFDLAAVDYIASTGFFNIRIELIGDAARVSCSITASETATGIFQFRASDKFTLSTAGWSGDGISGMYATYLQVTAAEGTPPIIKTEGTTVTRSPDVVSIPTRNNLPEPGKPFTILVDAAVPLVSGVGAGTFSVLFETSTTPGLLSANRVGGGAFHFVCNGATAIAPVGAIDENKHRLVFVEGGDNLRIYSDGVLVATKASGTAYPSSYGTLSMGLNRTGIYHLNSNLKNFRIYHTALSDEQIAALGGPQ